MVTFGNTKSNYQIMSKRKDKIARKKRKHDKLVNDYGIDSEAIE